VLCFLTTAFFYSPVYLYNVLFIYSKMYFKSFSILSLIALSIAAPTTLSSKRAIAARQSGPVLKDTTYNAISISGGKAGNAKAEADAVFSALDLKNPENIDSADLTFLNEVNQVANDAETDAFNPAVEAATGDEATQIQVISLSLSLF
jgi:hypothetical protein